jgi:hypothetical protein
MPKASLWGKSQDKKDASSATNRTPRLFVGPCALEFQNNDSLCFIFLLISYFLFGAICHAPVFHKAPYTYLFL